MADEPISNPEPTPISETTPAEPKRRKVYESTLLPERKHRRASPWVVIPSLLIILGALLLALVYLPHQRRSIKTVNMIAYASDQGSPGTMHIWTANLDGSQPRQLTKGLFSDTEPTFSPDGNQIAFVSNRDKGIDQVYLMDADGQHLIEVTTNAGAKAHPSFAPNDNLTLGYTAGGVFSVVNTTTLATDIILPKPKTHAGTTEDAATIVTATIPQFAWTPIKEPGKHPLAAVEEVNAIQSVTLLSDLDADPLITVDGQPTGQRLPAADTLTVGWSPDGALLAVAMIGVAGQPRDHPVSAIAVLDPNGHIVATPFVFPGNVTGPVNPVFSPDSTQILYELWQQPDLAHRSQIGLALSGVNTNSPPKLIYRGDAENPQFTPDGNAVLFSVARKDHGHDLYRVNTDGTGGQPVLQGTADIQDIAISPQAAHA